MDNESPWVADMSQNSETQPRCGAWFPSFTTSSSIHSLSRQDVFTSQEIDFAMGFPVIRKLDGCKDYAHCVSGLVDELGANKYAKILGNGVHLPTQHAFMLYILSNVVRREQFESLTPSITFPDDAVFEPETPNRTYDKAFANDEDAGDAAEGIGAEDDCEEEGAAEKDSAEEPSPCFCGAAEPEKGSLEGDAGRAEKASP